MELSGQGEEVYELSGSDLESLGISPDHVGARRRVKRADRRYILPLVALTLGAAGSGVLTGTPNLRFRPDRLVLVDSVANNSTVTSVNAGNVNMFCGNVGSAPASAFSPLAINTSLAGQTVAPNTTVNVAATLAAAGTLSGMFAGLADQTNS